MRASFKPCNTGNEQVLAIASRQTKHSPLVVLSCPHRVIVEVSPRVKAAISTGHHQQTTMMATVYFFWKCLICPKHL